MPTYTCQVCHFSSKIKCNYLSHLKTKKHLKNVKELDQKKHVELEKKSMKPKTKSKPKAPESPTNIHTFNQAAFFRNLDNIDVVPKFFNFESFMSSLPIFIIKFIIMPAFLSEIAFNEYAAQIALRLPQENPY